MVLLYFLAVLIGSVLVFYSAPARYRVPLLFTFSIIFIGILSVNVALFSILFTTINYFFGVTMENVSEEKRAKRWLFWLFILSDIAVLAFFKYFNIFFENITVLFESQGIYQKLSYQSLMVPIGISYYTFQSLGYLIRIDRGSEKAERNFAAFGTYLLFFPKFIAGPVERSNHFFPQIKSSVLFEKSNIEAGARLILWGLFKKIAIADILFKTVSMVNSDMHQFTGTAFLITLFVQIIYIYCDFSGYTDIALGIARCFGIRLINNFNRPFFARSVSEFWRRWHISLSSWCNDFIYNPLIVKYRQYGNTAVVSGLFLTFFVVGIWHGPRFTFIILGLLQGIAIVYEFYTKRYRLRFTSRYSKVIVNVFSRVIVFLFMSFSMVFFFANSVDDAWYFITHLFTETSMGLKSSDPIPDKNLFLLALILFIAVFLIEMYIERGKNLLSQFLKLHFLIRWSGYLVCIFLIWLTYSGLEIFYYSRF